MKRLQSLDQINITPLKGLNMPLAIGGETCAEGSCVTDNCDVERYYRKDDGTIEYWTEYCL